MAEKRGKTRSASRTISEEKEAVVHLDDDASDPSLSDSQIARLLLRRRWELASVLNFLHVFEPLIDSKLQISAEEIETALISPNNNLARLHISLLKGIPPLNRKLKEPGSWVTATCKKLETWWQWVADGENPLQVDHGKEITTYKQLDPMLRLLILKALCEVRAEQDDVLRYITDALKAGTEITSFRKERIADDVNGTTYWYDGDPVTGYRLYREKVKIDFKKKGTGKGRLSQPAMDFRWETLATNLEEFQDISEKLSSSKVTVEAAAGKIVKAEVIPLLEEVQKKKMRALKRQHRQAMLLGDFPISRVGTTRSCRERRPVNYTFDDFDRSINEAIQISKRPRAETEDDDDDGRRSEQVSLSGEEDITPNGIQHLDKANSTAEHDNGKDGNCRGRISYDDNEEIDREKNDTNDDGSDDDDDDDDYNNDDSHRISSNEKNGLTRQTRLGAAHNRLDNRPAVSIGLRRSRRNAASDNENIYYRTVTTYAEMKKRLRQRPTHNVNYAVDTISDSEGDPSDSERTEISGIEVSGSTDRS